MRAQEYFRSLGPAIIVASVVLGPGSILISSRVGCQYGYRMLWLLAFATLLMIAMTTLGALIGVRHRETPCEAVASRFGRPWAALVGLIVFLIIACYQASNNLAVLTAVETLTHSAASTVDGSPASGEWGVGARALLLLVLNGIVVAALYGLRTMYRPLERLMMVLVMVMLGGFLANLLVARPSPLGAIRGLLPSLPEGSGWVPHLVGDQIVDTWLPLQGLLATTLSVAGAFYQAYLVREKGWSQKDVQRGLADSITGIGLLGCVSAMIMMTSAAALHGRVAPESLTSVGDVATQLEPLFGSSATFLFSVGILAAAFSSFLGNALVGGTFLSDGLGLGSSIDARGPKALTVVALALGMLATLGALATTRFSIVDLIILAQAMSVLGVPVLAVLMMWLGISSRAQSKLRVPTWVLLLGGVATLLVTALVIRSAYRLYLQFA